MFDDLRKPDLIGIGGMRCGSTWVWNQLNVHPEIVMARPKELKYFNWVSKATITPREYLQNFQYAPAGRKTGEFTPDYLAYPHVPVLIKAVCPDAKLITILRNPVDRAFSQFTKSKEEKAWGIPANLSFLEAFYGPYPTNPVPLRFCSLRHRGLYGLQLEWWYDVFPKEQIKVLFFEDIKGNPKGLLQDLFRFLGVNPDFVPPDYETPKNTSQGAEGEPITAEERSKASDFYKEDLVRLEKLTGRDLTHWR
jgi:hypothetical protein